MLKKSLAPPSLSVCSLPGAGPPATHIYHLFFGFAFSSSRMGPNPDATPISVVGPGGSGSIVALNNVANLNRTYKMALGLLQEGTVGLLRLPLCPTPASIEAMYAELVPPEAQPQPTSTDATGTDSRDKTEQGKRVPSRAWKTAAYSSLPCVFCGTQQSPLSPAHVLTRCQHPDVVRARQRALDTLPSLIRSIVAICVQARGNGIEDSGLYHIERHIDETLEGMYWSGADGRFVLFRMLLTAPWPEEAVGDTPPTIPCKLSRAMGRVFDSTTARNTSESDQWQTSG